jgi:hypothetical protein
VTTAITSSCTHAESKKVRKAACILPTDLYDSVEAYTCFRRNVWTAVNGRSDENSTVHVTHVYSTEKASVRGSDIRMKDTDLASKLVPTGAIPPILVELSIGKSRQLRESITDTLWWWSTRASPSFTTWHSPNMR